MAILPFFDRHPAEGATLGRITLAFGELEAMLATSVGLLVFENIDLGLRATYKVKSTSARIDLADVLLRPKFNDFGMESDYLSMIVALKICRGIRNQYSHCNWSDDPDHPGIFFTDLEASADRLSSYYFEWRHVDRPILQAQLDYFGYVLKLLMYLQGEGRVRTGKLRAHGFSKPEEQPRPILHNPPSQHIPPWLGEDEKARHLERAQESERSPNQSERPPSVLRLTREEWLAKDAKEAREGRKPSA